MTAGLDFLLWYHFSAVTIEEGQKLAEDNNAMFFESSAKCNYNIDTVFRKVVEKLPGEGRQVELEESQKCNLVILTLSKGLRYPSECRAKQRALQRRLLNLSLFRSLFQQTTNSKYYRNRIRIFL